MEDYGYLGVSQDNRLDWKCDTEIVCKKGHSRLHFFRNLKVFIVSTKMLYTLYKFVVESECVKPEVTYQLYATGVKRYSLDAFTNGVTGREVPG